MEPIKMQKCSGPIEMLRKIDERYQSELIDGYLGVQDIQILVLIQVNCQFFTRRKVTLRMFGCLIA